MNVREIEVLNIVCGANEPLTSTNIVNRKEELTQSTVIAVLRKLEANELVMIDGLTHSGKVLSRTYIPGPNAKKYLKDYYLKEFEMTKNILSPDDLLEVVSQLKEEETHG